MESATVTRPRTGAGLARRLRAPGADLVARVAFGVLCLGALIVFFVYPTYPNYDSYYSLLWGREVLDLTRPVFEGFRVPTEHPLAIVAGAGLSLLGEGGDRVWIAMTIASLLGLVWGLYRLGRQAFTPLVGLVAAALLITRFDFAFLAARGYVDIPYMALVIWAAVLEAERPRRGGAVWALLALAGLLRPEAWLLAGLYFLWMAWPASWSQRVRYALLAAIGPVIWSLVDYVVTGDPLFSVHYTSSSAEELGRQRTLAEIPAAVPYFFTSLVKLPVLVAAIVGLGLSLAMAPRRMVMPLVLLATGFGTFVLIGVAGLSVIERYLIVAALSLLVFAAVTVGGWTMLRPGTWARRIWMGLAVLVLLYGVAFTVTRVNVSRFQNELQFRGDAHDALAGVLRAEGVSEGLRCGPLTLPNHKLVPDARWILNLPFDRVQPRADPDVRPRGGVALYVTSRFALFKYALSSPDDPATVQVPPAGWERVAVNEYFAAYVRCPGQAG